MSFNETDDVIISAEKYEEAGLFTRIGRMMKGLSCPRASREYKEALIELQRLSAPLTAILLPTIGVIILIVVSAVSSKPRIEIRADIAQADTEEEKLQDVEPPPDMEPPPETEVDPTIVTDVPAVGNPSEVANQIVSNEPVTPKVNNIDAMQMIKSPVTMKSVFGSTRSTGKRGAYTRGGAQYGDQQTEAAVLKALRWLKHTQRSDGSWDGNPAMTGFGVLTYLAHGETPSQSKEFGNTVQRAIEYLLRVLKPDEKDVLHIGSKNLENEKNGKYPYPSEGNGYGFAIVMYALSEAYGMTHNPDIKYVAEQGIKRIIDGQSSTGGWDYNFPKTSTRDDTSLGGWCIQAIKAAKMAGLHPDGMDECIKKAIKCLKTRSYSEKVGFKYTAGSQGNGGLAGVGCLAMQLLGYGKEPEVRNALNVMRNWLPSFEKIEGTSESPQYYCYYASQCKYQAGMAKSATKSDAELWKKWNLEMKKVYPPSIITLDEKIADPNGKMCEMGYWQNKDQHSSKPATMGTCLAALQLMVYYRYLPTTSLKATDVEVDINEAAKDAGNEVGVQIDL